MMLARNMITQKILWICDPELVSISFCFNQDPQMPLPIYGILVKQQLEPNLSGSQYKDLLVSLSYFLIVKPKLLYFQNNAEHGQVSKRRKRI